MVTIQHAEASWDEAILAVDIELAEDIIDVEGEFEAYTTRKQFRLHDLKSGVDVIFNFPVMIGDIEPVDGTVKLNMESRRHLSITYLRAPVLEVDDDETVYGWQVIRPMYTMDLPKSMMDEMIE